MTRSDRPERLAPGSGHLLRVVVDEWAARRPEPEAAVQFREDREFSDISVWRRMELDALLSLRVVPPQPLCLVTGI